MKQTNNLSQVFSSSAAVDIRRMRRMNRAAGGLSHRWQQGGRFARAAALFQEAPQPAPAIIAERPVLRPALGQVGGRGRRRPQRGLRLRVPPCGSVRLAQLRPRLAQAGVVARVVWVCPH